MKNRRFVLVGPGAVGKVLARRLVRAGWRLEQVIGHSSSAGRRFARSMKVPYSTSPDNITIKSGVILLAVPSSRIEPVARDLSRLRLSWKNLAVIHTSGLLDTKPLSPLKTKGCAVAACHPFMTFPRLKEAVNHEPEYPIVFGIDGDRRGIAAAREVVKSLGETAILVRGKDRVAYHGAAVIACTLLAANIKMAETILKKLKISDPTAKKAVISIAKETLRNIEEFGVERALTGPQARGDKRTVYDHTKAIRKLDDDMARVYMALSGWVMKTGKK